jgi:hypothetical protein
MAKRKAPSLGPIERGGVALPFLNRDIKMTICDPILVGRVAEVLRQLPSEPRTKTLLDRIVPSTFVAKLQPFTPGADDPVEWIAAELTQSIQAGILMDRVPEFDRLTDKQKLAQLDELDAAITRLDEAFGQLRREAWSEVVSVKPDLPEMPTIVRHGIYDLWPELHEAVRESRRRLQDSDSNRGDRAKRPTARAVDESVKIYRLLTGKDASVYWDAAASKYKGKCLPFLTEILEIFGLDGDPAQYLRKN